MEVLSPLLAAPKAFSRPTVNRQIAMSIHAPSIGVPLRFMVTGLGALAAGMFLLTLRPELLATYHYNQYVIAVTHLFVLGWIGSIVMGAVYQLVPVALETKLYSERLASWQFLLHLVGFSGMVWMFWTWNMKQVAHFGCILGAGVALFAYNLGRTLLRVPRWNVVATAVASALVWLCLTVLAGLTIAAGKCTYQSAEVLSPANPLGVLVRGLRSLAGLATRFDPLSAMHAHAHLGALGVFVMLIVGVSYKLVPMFTLSDLQNARRAMASVVLLNAGLMGSFITILLRNPLKLAFALVVLLGLALYQLELWAILRARKRRSLDWGLKAFLTAVGLLVPVSCLALVLSWPGLPLTSLTGQLENVYGLLTLLGIISFAIMGMLYKIIPFLVWYRTYSQHIGRRKIPSLADLYSPAFQVLGYWTYLAGLAVITAATLSAHAGGVRVGCILLGLSLGFLAANVFKILSHLFRPQLPSLTTCPNPQASQ